MHNHARLMLGALILIILFMLWILCYVVSLRFLYGEIKLLYWILYSLFTDVQIFPYASFTIIRNFLYPFWWTFFV